MPPFLVSVNLSRKRSIIGFSCLSVLQSITVADAVMSMWETATYCIGFLNEKKYL